MTGDLSVTRLQVLVTTNGVPRYRQIAEQLAALSADAEPGVRLPSEHDIAGHLNVSRATAIQALRELEQRGLVHRRQGRGSFVADTSRAIRSMGNGLLPSFSQDLRDAGRVTNERILSCATGPAPAGAASELELPSGAECWCVCRVIFSDAEPVIHATSWLPAQLYPQLERDRIESSSLYDYLDSRYGPRGRPSAAEEKWAAQAARRDPAKALDLPVGAPVMRVQRRAVLSDGTPAEYALSYVRAETFVVSVQIVAGQSSGTSTAQVRATAR